MHELKEVYKVWHGYLLGLPKTSRFTIGKRIDELFIDILLLGDKAQYAREKKLSVLYSLSEQFDRLKYLITLLWELRALDKKKMAILTTHFVKIGKMLGGWIKRAQHQSYKENG